MRQRVVFASSGLLHHPVLVHHLALVHRGVLRRLSCINASKLEEDKVAKGQVRSNREKKKPKADKNKKKDAAPASPFASARVPGKPGYAGKKNP
jgi:hypothetical protein